MSDDVSFGREWLERFAAAVEAGRPADVPDGGSRALAMEIISEDEAEEIAMRHLWAESETFVRSYVELHGSTDGIDDAAEAAGLPSRDVLELIFEEMAALFRERIGEPDP